MFTKLQYYLGFVYLSGKTKPFVSVNFLINLKFLMVQRAFLVGRKRTQY